METLEAIFTRRSVRSFEDREVPEDIIHTILRAGMSGPSCVNGRMWSFVVVKDRERLKQMAEKNVKYATPLHSAAFAVLVCGDLERAIPGAPEFWVIDGSIAAQNMILAAHALGVGSVWLGTWPVEERVRGQAELFGLPETVVPHSIIAFGWPKDGPGPERDLFEPGRVHYERW